jgi:phosphoribosyl 1,2-cyclic phosphodiesterase
VYLPRIKMNIYAPYMINGVSMEDLIKTELSYEYWPVGLNEMLADISFHPLRETSLHFKKGLRVVSKYMNHPVVDLGYRFEYAGKIITVIHDNEPYFNQFPPSKRHGPLSFFDEDASRDAAQAAVEENQKIVNFMRNADVAVYDAQYTEEEYRHEKLNWGHSCYETAIQNALAAGVKRLILNHHDPSRSDAVLEQFETEFRKQYSSQVDIQMAREGMKIDL